MLVGETGVGKTSLCHRFVHENFPSFISETASMTHNEKVYKLNGESVTVKYQDTQGFESCGSLLPPSLCRGTSIIMLVYALDNDDSIKTLYSIGENIVKYMPFATKIMVGNKFDLMGNSVKINNLISGNQTLTEVEYCLKVSALTGQGIMELEQLIVKLMAHNKRNALEKSIQLNEMGYPDNDDMKDGCCKNI